MYLQGRGNEYWSIIPDLTRVGHDIDPTECKTWCPPRIDSIDEPLQTYRKDQSSALAAKIMTLVGQDKVIKTKLLKPHKFGDNAIIRIGLRPNPTRLIRMMG